MEIYFVKLVFDKMQIRILLSKRHIFLFQFVQSLKADSIVGTWRGAWLSSSSSTSCGGSGFTVPTSWVPSTLQLLWPMLRLTLRVPATSLLVTQWTPSSSLVVQVQLCWSLGGWLPGQSQPSSGKSVRLKQFQPCSTYISRKAASWRIFYCFIMLQQV